MPIRYTSGNIFEADAQCLVNPVNCQGVMGAGLAKEFKKLFPQCSDEYQKACKEGLMRPGLVMLTGPERGHHVLHFATKDDWRQPSLISWIRFGLSMSAVILQRAGLQIVAFPAVGCGHGELSWSEVRREFEQQLGSVRGLDVICYEPVITQSAPPKRQFRRAS
jgi:O-acetyl-ADP-ribose deacetylase (regulator of RNase III)